jgi:iron complex outermembrane recepter protein
MQGIRKKSIYLAVALMMQTGATLAEEQKTAEVDAESLPEVSVQQKRIKPATPNDAVYSGSKTETPIRDIPASVSVVTSEMLEEQGIRTMNEAMIANAPGVQPQMGGGYGFGDSFNSRGLSLSFLRDTMPDGTAQNNYFRTMYDIERIEVLKGPGSALFGPVGPGGTINVLSKQPQDKTQFTVGSTFGSFGTFNGFVDATGKIADGVAGRLIVDSERTDGFRGLNRDITEFSPSIRWNYDDDKILNVDIDRRIIKIKPDNYGILFDRAGNIADVDRDTRYYTPFNDTDQKITRVNFNHDWQISDALKLRTALTNDQRDLYILRNAGGGVNAANASNARNVRQQYDDARYTNFQNELTWNVSTGGIQHTLLGGLEFADASVDTRRIDYTLPNIANILNPVIVETSLAGLAQTPSFDRKIKSDIVSFYVQDQMAFTEQFKVRVGARNDHVDYEDKGFQRSGTPAAYRYREIEETKDIFSGNIGAVYQPNSQLAFYAGYSEGGFINLATEATAVATDPETSKQTEVGVKTSFFEDKAHLNVALFKTRRENYFVTLPGSNGQATPDGKDETKGVEFEAELFPLLGWKLTGNAVFMDAKNKSRNVASNALFGVVNRSLYGARPTAVSEEIFSLWSHYQIQSGFAEGLSFGIGAVHKGEAYADSLNLLEVPSYTIYNAVIGYKQPKWEAAITMNNLTDKKYYTNPTFSGVLPGDPRSIFATLKFDFK